MAPRRPPRDLSAEDRALWDRVRATARPLHGGSGQKRTRHREEQPDTPVKQERAVSVPARRFTPALPVSVPPTPPRQADGMDRKRFERLRKGQIKPEARLDLHGMTMDRAHAALTEFIWHTHSNGLRLVLVITGKGSPAVDRFGADGQYGVLRQNVPRWLTLPPIAQRVLQVAPAHRRHGGDGALYVYLRRPK